MPYATYFRASKIAQYSQFSQFEHSAMRDFRNVTKVDSGEYELPNEDLWICYMRTNDLFEEMIAGHGQPLHFNKAQRSIQGQQTKTKLW